MRHQYFDPEAPDDVLFYRVYDLELEEYWSNDQGKTIWPKPGHAKNAWNMHRNRYREVPPGETKRGRWIVERPNPPIGSAPTFTQQKRFVIAVVTLELQELIPNVSTR